jgi:transcriptional regulator with XRE-family HTH domain
MPKGRTPDQERNRRMAELRAEGKTLAQIARLLGMSRQTVRRALESRPTKRPFRIRCRLCDQDINPAGAVPRDDRDVLCLSCLAKRPELSFGEHLKAFRLAAGIKVVTLAKQVKVRPSVISSYEHGRTETPTWQLLMQLLQVLGVRLAVRSHGVPEFSRTPTDAPHLAPKPSAGVENPKGVG